MPNEKNNNPAENLPSAPHAGRLPDKRPGEMAVFENGDGGGAGMLVEVERSRAIQEVQASMIVAQRFPRDPEVAVRRINRALELTVARFLKTNKDPNKVWGIYSYPRGEGTVSGPNIRMAEILAQNWHNIRTGTQISHSSARSSDVRVYCTDLETNFSQESEFTVPHVRYSKEKGNVDISKGDPRDVYELVANQASRRRRACILAVIPGDVIDAAVDRVRELHRAGVKNIPLAVRVRSLVEAFAKIGVPPESLKDRLDHDFEAVNESELDELREIYTAIKDGHGTREEYFSLRGVRTDDSGAVPMPQEKKTAPGVTSSDDASRDTEPATDNAESKTEGAPNALQKIGSTETTRFWTAYWAAFPASKFGRDRKIAMEIFKSLGFTNITEIPLSRFDDVMKALSERIAAEPDAVKSTGAPTDGGF